MKFTKEIIMGITAKELAQKLNLSEAAISMALNNKPGVSTKTRKKIIEEAKKYGYDFTRIKEKELPSQEQGTICFIVYRKNGALVPNSPILTHEDHGSSMPDTPFFSQLSEGISLSCKENHYRFHISYLYEGDDIAHQLQELYRIGTSGLLLLGTEMEKHDLIPFANCNIPMVLLDHYFEDLQISSVITNNIHNGYLATNHLIRKRHAQPGYLRSSYRSTSFEERADGFYKAIRRNGMSTSRSVVHDLSPTIDGAYSDMKEVLSQNVKPQLANCYFADNDLIAAGAIRAFTEAGYKIPEDIAIVGFDNMPLCTYITPTLTTIHVPKQYMGEIAVKQLVEMIKNPRISPVKIEVATSLKERKSC